MTLSASPAINNSKRQCTISVALVTAVLECPFTWVKSSTSQASLTVTRWSAWWETAATFPCVYPSSRVWASRHKCLICRIRVKSINFAWDRPRKSKSSSRITTTLSTILNGSVPTSPLSKKGMTNRRENCKRRSTTRPHKSLSSKSRGSSLRRNTGPRCSGRNKRRFCYLFCFWSLSPFGILLANFFNIRSRLKKRLVYPSGSDSGIRSLLKTRTWRWF